MFRRHGCYNKNNDACSKAVVNFGKIFKSKARIPLKKSLSSLQPPINILVPKSLKNASFNNTITYFVLSKYRIIIIYYSALGFIILCLRYYFGFAYLEKITAVPDFDIFFKSLPPYWYLELPNAELHTRDQFSKLLFRYVTFTLHRLNINFLFFTNQFSSSLAYGVKFQIKLPKFRLFQITNLMHNSFILQQYVCYTTIPNMFRAARCSSSGGQIVSPQPLYRHPL